MENNMNMNDILGKIENIKNQLARLQVELKKTTVRGEDEQGLVTAIVSGKGKIVDYEFNFREFKKIHPAELKKAIIEATNNGVKKAEQLETDRKKEIIGDFNLPDIPGIL
ncbi:YbaB/EbfC family nucleoid-associated protein [Halothermothrix orenii]|uniref:Uncharacterized protein conserved in bacteria n=1 Tax=Halothermothrix orenii (strain H 168 / OCM 544 / DSM 9562) TaxID=373903 RepID=B8D0K9_HALOH|nr:YbaB/EbfC family nucleoid-associated protein [Halothermothrix orenii]ACL70945.1 uncharacterized protein conserved in bacteria [Halothermothrix orenii H 168]